MEKHDLIQREDTRPQLITIIQLGEQKITDECISSFKTYLPTLKIETKVNSQQIPPSKPKPELSSKSDPNPQPVKKSMIPQKKDSKNINSDRARDRLRIGRD